MDEANVSGTVADTGGYALTDPWRPSAHQAIASAAR